MTETSGDSSNTYYRRQAQRTNTGYLATIPEKAGRHGWETVKFGRLRSDHVKERRNCVPKNKPYILPDDQCERLKRSEMMLLQRLIVLASDLEYTKDEMQDRMKCVPYGAERLNMLIGNANSLIRDIIGTVSEKQRKSLRNSAKDMTMDVRPKYTPSSNRVMVPEEEFKELTDLARYRCKRCAETGDEARNCKLYKWLETNIPLEDYGDNLICPYSIIDWED